MFTAVTLDDLKQPEKLYLELGCKLAVGMPFKDIASSDTLLMRELPPADHEAGRRTLRRLQEVGMHVITPIEHLRSNPLDHAIPLVTLAEAQDLQMPPNCERCVSCSAVAGLAAWVCLCSCAFQRWHIPVRTTILEP